MRTIRNSVHRTVLATAAALFMLAGHAYNAQAVQPPFVETSPARRGQTVPLELASSPPPLIILPAIPNPTRKLQGCPWPPYNPQGTFTYVFPVQPPEAASYQSGHHDYPATDIFADAGTNYVAATEGCVEEIGQVDDWDPATDDPALRSGLFVSIVGDDGVRYYGSHLQSLVPELHVGQRVQAGQLLGAVGHSGNARYTPTHVHFGISYPTLPTDWAIRRGLVWPYDYLRAWTRGEAVTPDLAGVMP